MRGNMLGAAWGVRGSREELLVPCSSQTAPCSSTNVAATSIVTQELILSARSLRLLNQFLQFHLLTLKPLHTSSSHSYFDMLDPLLTISPPLLLLPDSPDLRLAFTDPAPRSCPIAFMEGYPLL